VVQEVEQRHQREVTDVLVERGALTAEQRDWALQVHERTGSPLASILVASGMVSRRYMYWVLGELWNAPYLDLTRERLDTSLLTGLDPPTVVREGWLPISRLGPDQVLVAGMRKPTSEWLAHIEGQLGKRVAYAVTTDWDLRYALQYNFKTQLLDQAALGLWHRSEEQSARRVMFTRQKVFLAVAAVVIIASLVLRPLPTAQVISAVASLAFLVFVGYKFVVCMSGARLERHEAVTDEEVRALKDEDLPVYTVLVPLFHEASVIGQLTENLSHLDYPAEKLDILLLLEEDDTETIEALVAAKPPPTMTIIRVPRGSPQTKPKACNVGLFFARGDLLVIYDAEDRPDPDQLKKSVIAFGKGDEQLVCVQAALNYWNTWENILTRMFTVEYSYWFDYMLPGLDELKQAIPLGGTSNHFKTDGLRKLGGWDPFNVTEDADLGIRATALGYTVGVVNSTTYEEANRALGNWIRQRSRWIKGYMQTSLVHTRNPIALTRVAGLRATIGFLLLILGTPVTFLLVLPMYFVFIASLFLPSHIFLELFPGWVLWVSLINLIVGNALMIYVCMMGAFKRENYALVGWALLNPLYWILHSVAAYKALWQLATRPYYWEKTAHGISSLAPAPVPAPRNPSLDMD
jgi:cellulose synthase/poly-beta-1,6-N-acetylglucosamine synthase-like glycosyltransferase